MASDLLHIKDGYFFELPTILWRSNRETAREFPAWFIRNDPDYQSYEADYLIGRLAELGVPAAPLATLKEDWHEWQAQAEAHYGWPLDRYLDGRLAQAREEAREWADKTDSNASDPLRAYLAEVPQPQVQWYYNLVQSPELNARWEALRGEVDSREFLDQYLQERGHTWGEAKIAEYNRALDGKVLIPQPFGTIRNAYEPESGFAISRYMLIEVAVAIVMLVLFGWLARRVRSGAPPTGKAWNLLESFVQGVRNQIVVPAMGEHDADRFMPFFYTLFFFILGCNLMGMLPFVGAPTAAFGSTFALAAMVFVVGVVTGVRRFGLIGYLKNISPSLGLPWYLAIFIVPLLWIIEALSLLIKHIILAMRLLLNMSAGHLVLLGILGIGISVEAAQMPTAYWSLAAAISVLGTTLLNFLELFVAFLQAYVFVFLSAILIGSAIHHH